ncbi:hypothetical protein ACFS7Z_22705 [Pontibacter toksunensis]|uniref:Uncharacterized protein n=1 Tax=Pontibacter toksunensis TaxID=1332631 RepID=A0ABW6C0I8_9BACT
MFKEYFLRWFENKDKSLLIGQTSGIFLIILLFITVWAGEKEKVLGTSLLLAGVAMGWVTGVLLSPYQMYNNEATKFNRALQIVSTFISGAVAAKLLTSLTPGHIREFFNDYDLLTRSLYFLSAFILSAILVVLRQGLPELG